MEYYVIGYSNLASSTSAWVQVTLSTANNTASDQDFVSEAYVAGALGPIAVLTAIARAKLLTLASKTTYYLNTRTPIAGVTAIGNPNSESSAIIRAICAYL